jgi:hypothetical protein
VRIGFHHKPSGKTLAGIVDQQPGRKLSGQPSFEIAIPERPISLGGLLSRRVNRTYVLRQLAAASAASAKARGIRPLILDLALAAAVP